MLRLIVNRIAYTVGTHTHTSARPASWNWNPQWIHPFGARYVNFIAVIPLNMYTNIYMPAKYMTETVNQLDPIRSETQLNSTQLKLCTTPISEIIKLNKFYLFVLCIILLMLINRNPPMSTTNIEVFIWTCFFFFLSLSLFVCPDIIYVISS